MLAKIHNNFHLSKYLDNYLHISIPVQFILYLCTVKGHALGSCSTMGRTLNDTTKDNVTSQKLGCHQIIWQPSKSFSFISFYSDCQSNLIFVMSIWVNLGNTTFKDVVPTHFEQLCNLFILF